MDVLGTWGASSARPASGFAVPGDPLCFDTPLGSQFAKDIHAQQAIMIKLLRMILTPMHRIVRWDARDGSRRVCASAHDDVVTCSVLAPDQALVLTASHAGDIATWTPDWTLCSRVQGSHERWHHGSQMHLVARQLTVAAAWSPDGAHVLLLSHDDGACMAVWHVDKSGQLEARARLDGAFHTAFWCDADTWLAVDQTDGLCVRRFALLDGCIAPGEALQLEPALGTALSMCAPLQALRIACLATSARTVAFLDTAALAVVSSYKEEVCRRCHSTVVMDAAGQRAGGRVDRRRARAAGGRHWRLLRAGPQAPRPHARVCAARARVS